MLEFTKIFWNYLLKFLGKLLEMAENGDQLARDTLLRIIQRDKDPAKVSRAQSLINSMDNSDIGNL